MLAMAALGAGAVTLAAPFTPGNAVVYRVGDGTAALSTAAAAIFLDEYTNAGALVQTIALPATGTSPLTAAGTATSEGILNFSPDGLHLAVPGYDAIVGTTSIATSAAASAPRSVVLLDRSGTQQSFTTLGSAFDAGNIRSAVTDGANIWAVGSGTGVVTATPGGSSSTTVSTTATNLRDVAIFGGQLYISSGAGTIRMGSVGSGTPITSGQTITALPGFPANQAISQFFFADLDPSVPGVDTLYVANQTQSVISKYSLVGGTWTLNNSMGLTGPIGLAGTVSGSNVSMYITATPNALFTLSDTSGYNQAMNGNILFVAMAATNTALRGVAVVPPAQAPTPTGVVSRKTHGGAGDFDVNLPLSGTPGIECRSGGGSNDYQVVFTFPGSVTFNSASVTAGTGSVISSSGSGTSTVTVNLTGITNAQRITITLSSVNNGTSTGDVSVPMGVLVGDTNGDGTVNSADIGQTKSQSGNTVTASNFREDVNVDGNVNSSDIGLVKSKSGTALP
jgi:hypothetical protein